MSVADQDRYLAEGSKMNIEAAVAQAASARDSQPADDRRLIH